MKKIRLVISGSGTRYPVQIGAVCELLDMGYEFPEILGASGGAITGAAAAKFKTSAELEKLATTLLPKKFLTRSWFPFGGKAGLYTMDGIEKTFTENLHKNVEDGHSRLHIVTTNWTKGEKVVWRKGLLAPRLCASMCLPIFDMVEIAGDLYEDGGVSMNFGLDYTGWDDPNPAIPTIGLKVRSPSDDKPRKAPFTKLDRAVGTIENMLRAQDREHIEDAHWAKVVMLDTTSGGLDLQMGEKDVQKMLQEGRAAIKKALAKGVLH
jgi:predicted acylesterase/phospholipase RssA